MTLISSKIRKILLELKFFAIQGKMKLAQFFNKAKYQYLSTVKVRKWFLVKPVILWNVKAIKMKESIKLAMFSKIGTQ